MTQHKITVVYLLLYKKFFGFLTAMESLASEGSEWKEEVPATPPAQASLPVTLRDHQSLNHQCKEQCRVREGGQFQGHTDSK